MYDKLTIEQKEEILNKLNKINEDINMEYGENYSCNYNLAIGYKDNPFCIECYDIEYIDNKNDWNNLIELVNKFSRKE